MSSTTNSPSSPKLTATKKVNPSSKQNQPGTEAAAKGASTTKNQPPSVNPSSSSIKFNPIDIETITTQPLMAPSVHSKPLISERLIIRTYTLTDFVNYHSLDSQPEPNILGQLNRDKYFLRTMNDSLKGFRHYLQPGNTNLHYGIFTKKPDGEEDEYIGSITIFTSYKYNGNWPNLSYKLKKEYWGKGYGTEAIKTWTSFWWSLPRVETVYYGWDPSLTVWKDSQIHGSPRRSFEVLRADIEPFNKTSLHLLQKVGFEIFKEDEHLISLQFVWKGVSTQPIRDEYKEGGKIKEKKWDIDKESIMIYLGWLRVLWRLSTWLYWTFWNFYLFSPLFSELR
jgi:RimJ/RimL family protein N-acetyltransferase